MNEPLGFSREGEVVTIRLHQDDWELLLLSVGFAAGTQGTDFLRRTLGLMDRINCGNPDYRPYNAEEAKP